MSPTTCHGPSGVDLSREEAWVQHVAVLDHVERVVTAGETPVRALTVPDRIESCIVLCSSERDLVSAVLVTVDDPESDRPMDEA